MFSASGIELLYCRHPSHVPYKLASPVFFPRCDNLSSLVTRGRAAAAVYWPQQCFLYSWPYPTFSQTKLQSGKSWIVILQSGPSGHCPWLSTLLYSSSRLFWSGVILPVSNMVSAHWVRQGFYWRHFYVFYIHALFWHYIALFLNTLSWTWLCIYVFRNIIYNKEK